VTVENIVLVLRMLPGDPESFLEAFSVSSESWFDVLPYMMAGRCQVMRVVKSKPKGEPCFYLDAGTADASNCSEVMLSPPCAASYSTDVTWGCQSTPFRGKWITDSEGATMAGLPSLVNGEAVNALAQRPEAPQDVAASHEPLPSLTSLESSRAPLPAASSVSQQHEPSLPLTGTLPESLPTLPHSASEAPVQQQQQSQRQPRASPAVTRSVSWRQRGPGQRHGFVRS